MSLRCHPFRADRPPLCPSAHSDRLSQRGLRLIPRPGAPPTSGQGRLRFAGIYLGVSGKPGGVETLGRPVE